MITFSESTAASRTFNGVVKVHIKGPLDENSRAKYIEEAKTAFPEAVIVLTDDCGFEGVNLEVIG